MRWRWLWVLSLAGALLGGGDPCRAQQSPVVRVQTAWLKVEVDSTSGAITGLAADPAGGGDFSQPLLGPANDRPACGIYVASRPVDAQILTAAPGEGFAVTAVGERGVTVTGLRIGDALSARLEASLASDAPELTIRAVVRANGETTCQWAGLLLAPDPALSASTVYFAGRQGLASISPGRITMSAAPVSGAVCKQSPQRSFAFTCAPPAGVEVEIAAPAADAPAGRAAIAIAPAIGGPPVTLRPGKTVMVEARFVFGGPRLPALKPATSKFQPLAQDFIFWATHVATARRFGERWMQETAAVIDPGLPADTQQAYRRCWLRDVAHGWKSASLVAGPEMLEVMRDEILTFVEKLNDAGHPPTSVGPDGGATYGNLDSAGLLIGMIYDYFSRTGDTRFVSALLPQADRMGGAILGLLGRSDLPVIGPDGDTYPDLGFIKGEQTYLTAVCCDGLRKLARLHEVVGDGQAAGRWHLAANRVAAAANRSTDKGGLWDPERGVYAGWRNPDGSLYRPEESFANLWAVYSGVCDAGDRIRAIFARLNDNWQRYYLDGLCPTAHSIEPYPNGLNQWVPWAGGWDVYLRAKLSEPRAEEVWRLFLADYERTDFPYREASGYHQEQANVGNRARIWDSWGFLQAVYAGHYGVEMAPGHLRILPRPLEYVAGDGISGLPWRDATYDISLRGHGLQLARVSFDGREWGSCVLPSAPGRNRRTGRHQVVISASGEARKAFIIDAAPMMEILSAEQKDDGLVIEASVPAPGREWLVLQWPDAWGRMRVESAAGVDFPQTARLAGERAAILVSVPRAGKFRLTLGASLLGVP